MRLLGAKDQSLKCPLSAPDPTWWLYPLRVIDLSQARLLECVQMSFSLMPIRVEKYMFFPLTDLMEVGFFWRALSLS